MSKGSLQIKGVQLKLDLMGGISVDGGGVFIGRINPSTATTSASAQISVFFLFASWEEPCEAAAVLAASS